MGHSPSGHRELDTTKQVSTQVWREVNSEVSDFRVSVVSSPVLVLQCVHLVSVTE